MDKETVEDGDKEAVTIRLFFELGFEIIRVVVVGKKWEAIVAISIIVCELWIEENYEWKEGWGYKISTIFYPT